MEKNYQNQIWGSFAGLAVGDAMGMPFHELTAEEIVNRCGGLAEGFWNIFPDEFIHLAYQAGQVTDDTTLTVVTARSILKYGLSIKPDQFVSELVEWVKGNQNIWQHGNVYGPSTRAAFDNYLNGKLDSHLRHQRSWIYSGTSNGAIMRVSPAGWASPGRLEEAVEIACNVVLPTHPTDVALSAAAGQAAAVSEALSPSASVLSVIDAALEGVRAGETIGKKIARQTSQRYPLPNLELALNLAEKARDPFDAAALIRRTIGSHFHVSETLATAIGIFSASKGDFKSGILAAINNGGDTDTIASIVGALSGALNGIKAIPEDWVNTVEQVNHLACESMADHFSAMFS